jgi:heme-degrading monooxygenase HmoA
MYARVSTVKVQQGKLPEAIRIYAERVLPALKQQKGFGGATLLTQAESGQGISITLWETEEDELASERSGFYREQLGKFAGMFDVTPIRETYEVSVNGTP